MSIEKVLMQHTFSRLSAFAAVAAMMLSTAYCSLADIRPDSIKTGITEDQFTRGREILNRAVEAHGGLDRWNKAGPVVVEFSDEWPGFLNRALFMPWPENPVDAALYLLPGQDNSRIVIRKGESRGEFMGLQNWVPYSGESEDGLTADVELEPDNDDIKFWVPTLNYFLQLPFRIGEADVVAYAGERELDGRVFQLVFVSWNRAEPQDMVDQYLLWIEKKTGYIEFATYTVRDMGGFVTGTMHYSDFESQDGLVIARSQAVVDSPEEPGEPLHRLSIQKIHFNADVSDQVFIPAPGESAQKH
ncbi:MAG: hypothetical protein CMN77_16310 [Spirochaetaceae bacterium]|nr:hypothetical protein [Spirochaetaceae bacterium]|tara:strand:- start:14227 stop:15132 length:906 start_codon:yes stop_codon:yes gene_type:complete